MASGYTMNADKQIQAPDPFTSDQVPVISIQHNKVIQLSDSPLLLTWSLQPKTDELLRYSIG